MNVTVCGTTFMYDSHKIDGTNFQAPPSYYSGGPGEDEVDWT